MVINVKNQGAYVKVSKIYAKRNGAIVDLNKAYIKKNGVWSLHSASDVVTYTKFAWVDGHTWT
jgi:choline kinase